MDGKSVVCEEYINATGCLNTISTQTFRIHYLEKDISRIPCYKMVNGKTIPVTSMEAHRVVRRRGSHIF
jgi:hypothetical protein